MAPSSLEQSNAVRRQSEFQRHSIRWMLGKSTAQNDRKTKKDGWAMAKYMSVLASEAGE